MQAQTDTRRPHRVVVGLEASPSDAELITRVLRQLPAPATLDLHFIHVIPELSGPWPGMGEDTRAEVLRATREKICAAVLAQLTDDDHPARVTVHVRVGEPATQIRFLAQDFDASLVVVGTHARRGLKRLLLGSIAEEVARTAPCPVLIVRPRAEVPLDQPEPPCPRCEETQRTSEGATVWCEIHSQHHARRRAYAHTSVLDAPLRTFSFGV
jgi:nucleotide-binding universal stress UspA family protein